MVIWAKRLVQKIVLRMGKNWVVSRWILYIEWYGCAFVVFWVLP